MTTKAENDRLRVVVCKDGDMYVAQCLEHDICVQAPDMKTLRSRFNATLDAEREFALANGKKPFEGIDPAPKHYFAMWEKGWAATSDESSEGSRPRVELALCAA